MKAELCIWRREELCEEQPEHVGLLPRRCCFKHKLSGLGTVSRIDYCVKGRSQGPVHNVRGDMRSTNAVGRAIAVIFDAHGSQIDIMKARHRASFLVAGDGFGLAPVYTYAGVCFGEARTVGYGVQYNSSLWPLVRFLCT